MSSRDLESYVARQLDSLFPDPSLPAAALGRFVPRALERAMHCFSRIQCKYFTDAGEAQFDHLHTDQYATFLYFLANTIHRQEGPPRLAAAVFGLNKALHALDAYFEVDLPDVFMLQHPVGTVLGRASYEDYFVAYQRVSVGANLDGVYPKLGSGVVMYGGSAVIGDSRIHSNCWLSVGSTVLDTQVPPNSVVFGQSPTLTIRPTTRDVRRDLFQDGSQ